MSSTLPESQREWPQWLNRLKEESVVLGFEQLRIAPAIDSSGIAQLTEWIDRGYAGGMQYIADRLDAYRHPDGVMPGTKSILVMLYPYPKSSPPETGSGIGRVARYAWPGDDYHDVIHKKLKHLRGVLRSEAPEIRSRGCIDTAPLPEREIAELSGMGWRGKNTLLLSRQLGSYFFLSCLLVDVDLPVDAPQQRAHCGTCTACMDQCPTDAFQQPHVLDATKCISYLTIEHRGSIPVQYRDGIGQWVFGCDVCQEVCPWNRKPSRFADAGNESYPLQNLDLKAFFQMDEEQFRRLYRKTPLWRTRLSGMQRNAAIVLGNQSDQTAVPVLERGANSSDAAVAEASRWAIDKINRRAETRKKADE